MRPFVLPLCLAAAALVAAAPAASKILKTRRPSEYRELSLTLGSGFEFETDGEESEYGFPFLAEYGLTRLVKLSVEPSLVWIRSKAGGSLGGAGDLETTVTLELPTERRYRPGVAFESVVKWPTARRGQLGTGKTDVSLGAILSKEFVGFDLDLNGAYTFVGSPEGVRLRDTFEASLACEWHLTPVLDLEGEAVSAFGAGGRFRATSGTLASFANIGGPEQGQSESEFTLGVAEFLNPRLKLEQGVVLKSDGAFQTVVGWEFDFGEGK